MQYCKCNCGEVSLRFTYHHRVNLCSCHTARVSQWSHWVTYHVHSSVHRAYLLCSIWSHHIISAPPFGMPTWTWRMQEFLSRYVKSILIFLLWPTSIVYLPEELDRTSPKISFVSYLSFWPAHPTYIGVSYLPRRTPRPYYICRALLTKGPLTRFHIHEMYTNPVIRHKVKSKRIIWFNWLGNILAFQDFLN